MGFQIKKISDHGPANPIVARLMLQTNDLLGFSTLPKERKENILLLYYEEITPRLLACDTIARRITKGVADAVASIEKRGLITQAQGRAVEVPQIMDLQQDAEQYLYSAKSVLREVSSVFKNFFDKEFSGAKFDKVIKWSEKSFGKDHELTRMLQEDHDLWLHQLIKMRNAVEHPGKLRLRVRNFELIGNNMSLPTWQLNDGRRCDLSHDMPAYVENMLTFCEDLIVAGIETTGKFPGVGFAEIPLAERARDCPKRLKAVFVGPK